MSLREQYDALYRLVECVRRCIESPLLYRNHFAPDNDRWSKFCVAMDTLEDSLLAIGDYVSASLGGREGERYLRLYGVLQAVFIQQDAIRAIWAEAVKEIFPEHNEDSAWKVIREVRNHSAGHPIETTRQGVRGRTFVTRIHLEHGILSLITDHSTGESQHWGGRLDDLVANYLQEAVPLIQRIKDKIPCRWPDLMET